jgi:hypothetical protein
MTSAILYLLPSKRSSSFERPKIFAFAMFTLENVLVYTHMMSQGVAILPIEEGEKVQDAKTWNYMPINLVDKRSLCGMCWTRHMEIIIVATVLLMRILNDWILIFPIQRLLFF